MTRPVFRFAPSPNGELHLGHALSALVGFERARSCGGRFLLRIEDIDTGRSRPEFVTGILTDLAWLDITWEEPIVFQSQRFCAYRDAAERLERMGLLYPCFATRAEIAAACVGGARDPDGAPLYSGFYRERNSGAAMARRIEGEAFALRLDMRAAIAAVAEKLAGASLQFVELCADDVPQTIGARPERWGDVVIVRKDIAASYHLAVVVDDAAQGVTRVTRGNDLYPATDLHRLLQVLLDLPAPIYHHHRLITDAAGRKLSKSERDTSLKSLRESGCSPVDIRRMIGFG